jgi:hypothetical protein
MAKQRPGDWQLIEVDMPNKYVTKERLWLNADKSRVVKDGDPEAAFLLASPGKEVPAEDVERYGLAPKASKGKGAKDGAPDAQAEGKAVAEPPANKAVKAPQATKGKE